jgi:membrane-associated phospholipid phosphatase
MVGSLVLPRSFTYFALILSLMLSPAASHAQGISPEPAPTQSSTTSASDGSTSSSSTYTLPDPADLEGSWRKMPARFLHDEKDMWLSPTKVGEDTNWLPAAIVVRRTSEFIKGDPPLERKVRQTDIFSEYTTLSPRMLERDASGEDLAEQEATGSSPQPQIQMRESAHEGLVMRSVKRTLEDQKELYLAPFKPSNFKWDALVLGGTGALIAADRHIEQHIGTAHYTFYQATSDVAIAGLGATLAGVWAWGIKGDHPHAKETGVLELETLVNTFLIYTPMQLLAARQRPGEGNGNGDFWQHHSINTSFPGGHAMFTFAMATVVSHEYSQWWVQALAYSAATIVTVTRFTARDHWSSDMLAGSALGIGIGAHIFHAHCNPELSDSCKHHVRWIF